MLQKFSPVAGSATGRNEDSDASSFAAGDAATAFRVSGVSGFAPAGVEMISVVADGTDQSDAINRALAESSSSTLMLPPGEYWIGKTIVIPDGKTLIGSGEGETVIKVLPSFEKAPLWAGITVGSDAGLSDLTLDVGKTNNGEGAAVRISGVIATGTDFLVENVTAKNVTGYSFWANGQKTFSPASGTFRDCTSENASIHYETTHVDGILFEGCDAFDGDGDIGTHSVFHPGGDSDNVTFLNCYYSGRAQAVNVLAVISDQSNIVFDNVYGETTGSAVAVYISGPYMNEVIFRNSTFIAASNNALNALDATVYAENSSFTGGAVGINIARNATGTFVDSEAIARTDPALGISGFALYGGPIDWRGGYLSANGGGGGTAAYRGTVTVSADTVIAVGEAPIVNEGATATFNILANDRDGDGTAPGVVSIDGKAVAAGGTVVLSSGAKVTLNANGSLTYDQNGAYAGLSQFGTGAPNSVAIESFSYVLESGRSAEVNVVIRGVASAGDVIAGDSGNNVLAGTAGDDRFSLAQGGDDTVSGLGGNDEFAFGKAFTAADRIDGGSGSDVLVLHGAYSSGVRLSANTLVNVETISLLSSPAGGYFGYNLTLHDGNVAAGAVLTVDGSKLRFGEALMLYGQAELDGGLIVSGGSSHDWIFGSQGADTIQGGLGRDRMWGNGGDDTFSVVGLDQFAGDRIDGGDGSDTLVLQGAMSAGIRFEADTMVNVETITLVSASTGYNSYNLTPHNATVAAGQTLTIDGSALQRGETMMIYGTAETDGRFVMRGGAGNDYLFGGAGDDVLIGGLGRDQLRGNGGADTFVYSGASQSTGTNFDRIVGFDWREDRIDLPDTVAGWNGAVDGALNAASFDADIAAAVNATLDAGSALLFTATSGNYSGRAFLVIDADGDGSYSAGQDYLMELVSPAVPLPGTTEFFV